VSGSHLLVENSSSKQTNHFHCSEEKFFELTQQLTSGETVNMKHSALENTITVEGREFLRRLLEEHIKFRGLGDVGDSIKGSYLKKLESRLISVQGIFLNIHHIYDIISILKRDFP